MRYLLVDNGSLRPASILNLRTVGLELGELCGVEITPASLLHSSKVPANLLGGDAAVNLERRIRLSLAAGERQFTIIPFFFGPTAAITQYLPNRLAGLRKRFGDFSVQRTPFLFARRPEGKSGLARILASRVREAIAEHGLSSPKVAMVDHGSPLPEVTEVRNFLAQDLAALLGNEVEAVRPCSMERREGEQYAFNEPLLEKLLRQPGWNSGEVVISMLFLSPGRHAGRGGDVDQICQAAEANGRGLRTYMTDLVGTHARIIPLLARRLESPRVAL